MRNTSRKFYFIISCIFLLILIYFGRSQIIDYIIEPLSQILWLFIRIFQTIDQEIYWNLLIFIVLILGISLIPSKVDQIRPKKYIDTPRNENHINYWKGIISSYFINPENYKILKSNLDQLHKEVTEIYDGEDLDEICLPPLKNNFWIKLYSILLTTPLFTFLKTNQFINKKELFRPISSYLKFLETTIEEKNGKFTNKT